MLAFAFPDRVARNRGNGSFVLANGRGAAVDQASALARAPYIAVAELTGTAASGRILLAAPIAQAELELRFADRIESIDEITFDRNAMALRARRKRTLHAITLSEAPLTLTPSADTAHVLADGLIAAGLDKLPWSKTAAAMARPRDVPAQGRRRHLAGPVGRRARAAARDLAGAGAVRQASLKEFSSGDLSDALTALLAWELRARLEREAPTHFEAPTGTQLPIDYEADRSDHRGAAAGTVRAQHPSVGRQRRSAAGAGTAVARAPPGTGHARPAGFLARQLCRGALRPARPLPADPWPEDPAMRCRRGG